MRRYDYTDDGMLECLDGDYVRAEDVLPSASPVANILVLGADWDAIAGWQERSLPVRVPNKHTPWIEFGDTRFVFALAGDLHPVAGFPFVAMVCAGEVPENERRRAAGYLRLSPVLRVRAPA